VVKLAAPRQPRPLAHFAGYPGDRFPTIIIRTRMTGVYPRDVPLGRRAPSSVYPSLERQYRVW
jgi:hypothetical protein